VLDEYNKLFLFFFLLLGASHGFIRNLEICVISQSLYKIATTARQIQFKPILFYFMLLQPSAPLFKQTKLGLKSQLFGHCANAAA
jgi:hypothetical protein